MSCTLGSVRVRTLRAQLEISTALIGLVGLGLVASMPASAQQVIALDQIVVEADADGAAGGASSEGRGDAGGVAAVAPVEGYVPATTTAGSKLATPIAEIPQAVSVVGRQELDDRGVQKLDEALRYVPGVFAQPFGADSDTDWIYIRGFDATQTGVFWDGLPLYSYAFGGFIIDPFLNEQIEVLKGPASVLYGGSSAGGIVNSISKRANGERIRYVETAITDDPNGYVGIDLGDRVSETSPWSWRVVGRVKGGDTQTDHADNFRGTVAPSLLFEPDADTRAEFYATYQYDDQRHQGGFWPYVGTEVAAPYGTIPTDLFYSEPDLDSFVARQATVGFDIEHNVSDAVTLRTNTRYAHVEREEYGPYPYDFDVSDGTLYRLNFAHDTTGDLFTTDNQVVTRFVTGGLDHELLTGFDYKYYRIDETQATGPADQLDPINPDYSNNLGALYDPYIDNTIELQQLGFYAQDQIKFGGGFIVTLNGRYDSVWIDRDDHLDANVDYDGQEDAWSGRAGLGYEFANGLTPYVSASRFFNPQIGTDASGNPVPAQDGEQYEVGFKYQPVGIDALFTVSLFDLTRRNTLQSDANFIPRAVGEINSRGVELEANVNLTDAWNVKGAFTAYDLQIEEDADPMIVGNQPYLVPEILGSLWLNYTVQSGQAKGLELGGGVRYLGKSYADNANELEVDDATLFDARIGYEMEDWGVSLNVNNVFDTEYVAGCQGAFTCGYGEGRTGLLKTHFRF